MENEKTINELKMSDLKDFCLMAKISLNQVSKYRSDYGTIFFTPDRYGDNYYTATKSFLILAEIFLHISNIVEKEDYRVRAFLLDNRIQELKEYMYEGLPEYIIAVFEETKLFE